jgi:hypothetical protein
MSKKADENYSYDDNEEKEEDRKCPPQRVPSPSRIPNNEWATSHKPVERITATTFEDDPREPSMKLLVDKKEAKIHKHKKQSSTEISERHEGQRNIAPKHEAVSIEEGVLFDEKEERKGGADGHVLASNQNQLWATSEDRNIARGTFSGRHTVSASRGPDYSLGAEPVDIEGSHCPTATEERRSWTQEFSPPHGAFREGGSDIEEGYEEDEFTITIDEGNEEQAPVLTREESINPVSAELVNAEEEEMHLQQKINQALERERQQAVVAEVDLAQSEAHRFGTRRRHWFVIGAVSLIVAAVTTTLVLILPRAEPLRYPNCNVSSREQIGNGVCDGNEYNTTECGWDDGDCLPCDDEYFGFYCDLHYPNCLVPVPEFIGDGMCDGYDYNTTECGWDGGDCIPCNDDYFGRNCTLHYSNCSVPYPELIGDGTCEGEPYNTTECGWDGGDCILCDDGYFGINCNLHYPNCSVPYRPEWIEGLCLMELYAVPCYSRYTDLIGDGWCDGIPFNTGECGWEGGDCCDPGLVGPNCSITSYPNCLVPIPNVIGDGNCDGLPFNTEECGWDGGDCCASGLVGPYCNITSYPNCSVPSPEWIGDGICDGELFDTKECGWDGGDCCTSGLVGPYCNITSYPNCSVPVPEVIGDGMCDGEPFNTKECGWDGGDCCAPGLVGPNCDNDSYPNCTVPNPNSIGNGYCDYGNYNTEECGWDGGDCR